MNVAQALREASAAGLDRLDGQLLLLQALGRTGSDRSWLVLHDGDSLEARELEHFQDLCRRRLAGEPVAYLLGEREFHGLRLQVDARVLVPRPDTETLVDWALELLRDQREPRVLDLGTGSGAIALAIASSRDDARVDAVDASAGALEVARSNAKALGLDIELRLANWLDGAVGSYHLIVSNPPYIVDGDPHLDALAHEPRSALVGGADGLDHLRLIVQRAGGYLHPGGWLLLEHGWNQAAEVRQLLAARGFSSIGSRRDLAGIERCSGGQWLERG